MIQLTWFVVPCSIFLIISLVSFSYWLSLLASSLDAFLVIALLVKIGRIGKEKNGHAVENQIEKDIEHQIKA
jgi:hypothetical protein